MASTSTKTPALPTAYAAAAAEFAAAMDTSSLAGRTRDTTDAENGYSAAQRQQADRTHLVVAFTAARRWQEEIALLEAAAAKQEQERLAPLLAELRRVALVWEFGPVADIAA